MSKAENVTKILVGLLKITLHIVKYSTALPTNPLTPIQSLLSSVHGNVLCDIIFRHATDPN